ncbi:MAG: response regulator [Deltaproteobacteria bacterium]|nr:response regulator [Deltaproteobacteria bacterium]
MPAKTSVLLAEQSQDLVEIITSTLKGTGIVDEIHVVQDGEEALEFIFRQGKYASGEGMTRPSLILLDVKLPKENGISVLRKIKSSPEFRSIPVVMLSSSESPVDIQSSYAEGANSYVIKPARFNDLMDRVERVVNYWIQTNALPD